VNDDEGYEWPYTASAEVATPLGGTARVSVEGADWTKLEELLSYCARGAARSASVVFKEARGGKEFNLEEALGVVREPLPMPSWMESTRKLDATSAVIKALQNPAVVEPIDLGDGLTNLDVIASVAVQALDSAGMLR
jgi:hypothetical protein